ESDDGHDDDRCDDTQMRDWRRRDFDRPSAGGRYGSHRRARRRRRGDVAVRAAHWFALASRARLRRRTKLKRAAIVILDGVGIGAAPDAIDYGDERSDKLGNLAR